MTAISDSQTETPRISAPGRRVDAFVGTVLVALVVAIYGQTVRYQFVAFDDNVHVKENLFVTRGVTGETFAWAFGIHGPSQWHPLAWLSHQVDWELFGDWAGGHHATNVVLHAITAVLLYAAVRRLTSHAWASAWVAAAFAVHPLNVESVAWIAERRNVLCGVFFMAGLNVYVSWLRRPRTWTYALLLLAHLLALMSKPLAVTFPCVLLLLDSIPTPANPRLGHQEHGFWRQRIVEKLPLFALSAVSAWLSIECQRSVNTLASSTVFPMPIRLANAVAAYGWYLAKTLWPTGLAVFYPHPAITDSEPWLSLAVPATISGLVLAVISAYALRKWSSSPWILVGWLWFLGTLVPMIGIVQVGNQQQADRYAYLSTVGLFLAIACDSVRRVSPSRVRRQLLAGLGMLSIALWSWMSWVQVGVWKDTSTLFRQALAVTDVNYLAYSNLAITHLDRGEVAEAIPLLQKAVELQPMFGNAHYNLGLALYQTRRKREALAHFDLAARIDPTDYKTRVWLGVVHSDLGDTPKAIAQFQDAHRLNPDEWRPMFSLGLVLASAGQKQAAADWLLKAHRARPQDRRTLFALASLLNSLNRYAELVPLLEPLVAADPSFLEARYLLGKALTSRGDQDRGQRLVEDALRTDPQLDQRLQHALPASAPSSPE